jgi:hypothetical protein
MPPTTECQGYIRRTHDVARTPLERFGDLDELAYVAQYRALCQEREMLNPRQLRRDIELALDHLFAYPNARPDQVEDVYQTLADPDRFPQAAEALRAGEAVDKPKSSLPTAPPAPTTTATSSSLRKETA